MMIKRCLMLRSRTPTSSPLAGQDVGMPSTTSCRVLRTLKAESCPLPCPSPNFTSMQEAEMQTTLMTPKAHSPRLKERRRKRTANLPQSLAGEQNIAGLIPGLGGSKASLDAWQVAGG